MLLPQAAGKIVNLHHLRIFHSVAKRLSYTKAAEDLSITQPAVTHQIRAFEEQLGLKLFEAKPGKVLLTEEGRILCQYAQRLFDLEGEIEGVISDLKGSRVGVVSLGTSRTYSHTFLHLLISHFHKFYPNITVKINEAGSLDIIQSLLDFQNELVICIKVADNPDICFIPFSIEHLVVVLPVGHRLSKQKRLSVRDLAGEKIILRGKGSASRHFVSLLFEKAGVPMNVLAEANNTELIKNMVQRQEGISFLSMVAVSKEVDEGKLCVRPLEDNEIPLNICIAYLKNRVLSPSATVFLNVLQELVPPDKPLGSATVLIEELMAVPDQP